MKNIKIISCGLFSVLISSVVIAKTEQITLKKDLGFGELFPSCGKVWTETVEW